MVRALSPDSPEMASPVSGRAWERHPALGGPAFGTQVTEDIFETGSHEGREGEFPWLKPATSLGLIAELTADPLRRSHGQGKLVTDMFEAFWRRDLQRRESNGTIWRTNHLQSGALSVVPHSWQLRYFLDHEPLSSERSRRESQHSASAALDFYRCRQGQISTKLRGCTVSYSPWTLELLRYWRRVARSSARS